MDYKILLIVILALTQLLTITVKALLNHIHRKNQKLNPGEAVDYSSDIKENKDAILRIENEQKKHGERLATLEQALKDLTWKVCKGGSN